MVSTVILINNKVTILGMFICVAYKLLAFRIKQSESLVYFFSSNIKDMFLFLKFQKLNVFILELKEQYMNLAMT